MHARAAVVAGMWTAIGFWNLDWCIGCLMKTMLNEDIAAPKMIELERSRHAGWPSASAG